jgi:hypothetical protein
MWIIRVNMNDQTATLEDVPEAYKYLAGRAMTSNLVADEVPPLAHPLGPNNKLVFSPGILSGTPASTAARLSVGGKSPLTGGIKESNAGSPWAADLGDMQVKALILEGQPADKDRYWGLHLTWDKAEGKPKVDFFDATEYTGKTLQDVYPSSTIVLVKSLDCRRGPGRRAPLQQLRYSLQRHGRARYPLRRTWWIRLSHGQQASQIDRPGRKGRTRRGHRRQSLVR